MTEHGDKRSRPMSAVAENFPFVRKQDRVAQPQIHFNHRPSSAPNAPNNPVSDRLQDRHFMNFDSNPKPSAPTLEDIYAKGSLKKSLGKGSIASAGPGLVSGSASGARQTPKTITIVDRAVGHAHTAKSLPPHDHTAKPKDRSSNIPHDYSLVPPTRREMNQMAHLIDMFDDSLIEKLDCIIVPKQR